MFQKIIDETVRNQTKWISSGTTALHNTFQQNIDLWQKTIERTHRQTQEWTQEAHTQVVKQMTEANNLWREAIVRSPLFPLPAGSPAASVSGGPIQ